MGHSFHSHAVSRRCCCSSPTNGSHDVIVVPDAKHIHRDDIHRAAAVQSQCAEAKCAGWRRTTKISDDELKLMVVAIGQKLGITV